jgi:hypothetical protein
VGGGGGGGCVCVSGVCVSGGVGGGGGGFTLNSSVHKFYGCPACGKYSTHPLRLQLFATMRPTYIVTEKWEHDVYFVTLVLRHYRDTLAVNNSFSSKNNPKCLRKYVIIQSIENFRLMYYKIY